MSVSNKLIDIEKLSRYHENLKGVLETKEAAGEAAKAEAAAKKYADEEIAKLSFDEAGAAAEAAATAEQNAKDFATSLVMDGETARFDEAGSAAEAYDAAKEYVDDLVKNEDGSVKFDDKGAASTAEQNAKDFATGLVMDGEKVRFDAAGSAAAAQDAAQKYADGLATNYDAAGTAAGFNTAMDERVVKLEAIDHDKLVADAIAAVVAGADSDFDTLKEVADWIANDKDGAAALQVAVSEHGEAIEGLTNDKQDVISDLGTIRDGAAAGAVAEQNAKTYAKDYADGLAGNYDAAGSASTAEQNAKDFATGLVMDGDKARFDAAGSAETAAAQALADAKSDAAGLYQVKGDYLIPSDLAFATDDEIDGLFA